MMILLKALMMVAEDKYTSRVKRLLKAELKRKGLTYRDLTRLLAEIGIHETSSNISNKISRGKFTAAFMVQCLEAAGCKYIKILDN